MACILPCHAITLQVRYAGGTATATICYQLAEVDGDVTTYYRTTKTIYTFTNGSYFVSFTSPDTDPVYNDETCEETVEDTDFDPEFDYGTPTDAEEQNLDEISPPTTGDALSHLVWEDPGDPGELGTFTVDDWRGAPVGVAVSCTASASGATASAEATRAQFRVLRGYTFLPIVLVHPDGQITLPADGSWSDWLSVTGEDESINEVNLYVGKYIPAP